MTKASLADRLEKVCAEIALPAVSSYPGVGSEDISCMMNRVQSRGGQSVFFRSLAHTYGGPHTRCYDLDETVLATSAKAFCAAAADLMGKFAMPVRNSLKIKF